MSPTLKTPCTAFCGTTRIAAGSLVDVALALKADDARAPGTVLVFDDRSGAVIDLDLRGDTAAIVARLAAADAAPADAPRAPKREAVRPTRGRGRPRLGVVAREVTLLPRHWEWLATQPGGASQALRRLVEAARRADGGATGAREAAYRFLTAIAGDLPGYEDVIRALFAGDGGTFGARMADWPADVRGHALTLAGFDKEAED